MVFTIPPEISRLLRITFSRLSLLLQLSQLPALWLSGFLAFRFSPPLMQDMESESITVDYTHDSEVLHDFHIPKYVLARWGGEGEKRNKAGRANTNLSRIKTVKDPA